MPGDESDPRNEWLNYSGLSEDQKRWCGRQRLQNSPPVFGAIFLIAAGILLFLNSLGWLPVRHIWDYWPLIFVWMGMGRFFSARDGAGRVLGIIFVAAGCIALLFTLHLFTIRAKDDSWALALLLMLFGAALLVKSLQAPMRRLPAPIGLPGTDLAPTRLHDWAILAGTKRKVDSQKFEGGTIFNFMGSVELDLRRAQIDPARRSAEVQVQAFAGAVKIRIPEAWRLVLNGSSVLGVFEDKTIPPNLGVESPALVITGYSAMSAVEIEN